jgi:co-chaperonin GroES (HSP10)
MLTVPNNMIAVIPLYESDYYVKNESIHIIKPDVGKSRCNQGIVKYVGRDVNTIRAGDYILFSGYTGSLVHIEGEGNLIFFPEDFALAKIDRPPSTEIPGLFFRDETGAYETATYEIATRLTAMAIEESDWFSKIKVKAARPTKEEYEEMQPSWQ